MTNDSTIEMESAEIPQTLGQLVEALGAFPDHALIFRSSDGDIGSGYHVTEFKQTTVKSIDCGGRKDQWGETVVQLLDGDDGKHMTIGKFNAIASKSEAALPGLIDAPLMIEFAIGNLSLHRKTITGIDADDQRVIVKLGEVSAVCKPLVDWQNAMAGIGCDTATGQRQSCC